MVNPTIVTRAAKGSPLTNTEIDSNFSNLKDAIVEVDGDLATLESSVSSNQAVQQAFNDTATNSIDNHEGRLDALEAANSGIDLSEYLKKDGSVALEGDLNAGLHSIKNVASPVDNGDAANKQFVEAADSALSTQITNVANSVAALDLSLYLKRDGSVALSGNLDASNHKFTNLSEPTDTSDAATKSFVLDRTTFVTETIWDIDNGDVYSSDISPSTFAYEFNNISVIDKITFDTNADTDNLTFPKKAYKSKVRFLGTFADFPDGIVDIKLVNRSTGKLSIDVELNDGTKITTIPPRSQCRIQWAGNQLDPVILVTLSKDHDSIESKKPSNNFLKFAASFNSDGTLKTNHSWFGIGQDGSPAITLGVTHSSTGHYDISWSNANDFDGTIGNIYSPLVTPSLILTSADTDDYRIYVKDLSSNGCTIHIKDSTGDIDKDFSIIVGGHNTVNGDNYENPFLV